MLHPEISLWLLSSFFTEKNVMDIELIRTEYEAIVMSFAIFLARSVTFSWGAFSSHNC
jgi:hypothetical protein